MVEVATVEVALKLPKVGVEVPTSVPLLLVERRAFGERAERVRVEVAVKPPPTKREPEK
jgi:hypothetical protein